MRSNCQPRFIGIDGRGAACMTLGRAYARNLPSTHRLKEHKYSSEGSPFLDIVFQAGAVLISARYFLCNYELFIKCKISLRCSCPVVTTITPCQPFWNWVVSLMPLTVAANALTLYGMLVNIAATLLLMSFYPDITSDEPVRAWWR